MSNLLNAVLDAYGGLDRWRQFNRVQATIVTGGGLWAIKGQPQDPRPRRMTVALDHEWASLTPFGADDQRTAFTPGRIAIEKLDGRVVSERLNPRESFGGHEFATPWDPLQRAYFNGYALWNYLTTPFLSGAGRCVGTGDRSRRGQRADVEGPAGALSTRNRNALCRPRVLLRRRPPLASQ